MNSLWSKGLKRGSQEFKDVEEAFKVSLPVRKRLVEMLNIMLKEELDKKLNDSEYSDASWAYKQADSIGYARAVDRLTKVLLDK